MIFDITEEELRTIIRNEVDFYLSSNEKNKNQELKENMSNHDDKGMLNMLTKELNEIFEEEVEDSTVIIEKIKNFIYSLKSENNQLRSKCDFLRRDTEKLKKEKITVERNREMELQKFAEERHIFEVKLEELNRARKYQEEKLHELYNMVQDKEKNICESEVKIKHLESEIDMLNSTRRNLEEKILYLENKCKSMSCELDQKTNEIAQAKFQIKNCMAEKEELADLYKIGSLYRNYLNISEQTKMRLANLIRSENIGSFAACCYNISTMDDIWDFVNTEIKSGNIDDFSALKDIFIYFIEQQNKRYNDATYRVLIPEREEHFDPVKHTDATGNSADTIKEVIFPGYVLLDRKMDENQLDEDRKIKKVKKLAIVKTV